MKNKDRSGHTDRGNKLIEENIQSSSRSRLQNSKGCHGRITRRTDRYSGVSLKSIAATIRIPEDRIRAKIKKVMMYRPALYEDRYIDIYRKYNFTCEDFCKLFSTEPYVYYYLSMINPKQKRTEPAKNAQSDPDIQRLISEK